MPFQHLLWNSPNFAHFLCFRAVFMDYNANKLNRRGNVSAREGSSGKLTAGLQLR